MANFHVNAPLDIREFIVNTIPAHFLPVWTRAAVFPMEMISRVCAFPDFQERNRGRQFGSKIGIKSSFWFYQGPSVVSTKVPRWTIEHKSAVNSHAYAQEHMI